MDGCRLFDHCVRLTCEENAMSPALKTPGAQEAKTRVQLDLAPSQMERLNWLMAACDIETRKDLFNSALSLFEWAVMEVLKGKTIASVDKESKHLTELAMPALADAARNRAALAASNAPHMAGGA
jgi:hypothetical protein